MTIHTAGQFFAEDAQRILITISLPALPVWRGAVIFEPTTAEAWVEFEGTVAFQQNGLSFTIAGALCVTDASAGLPAGTVWANGLPFDAAGLLCIDLSGDIFNIQNGIPFTEAGAVAAGEGGGGEDFIVTEGGFLFSEDGVLLLSEDNTPLLSEFGEEDEMATEDGDLLIVE